MTYPGVDEKLLANREDKETARRRSKCGISTMMEY
jgi:hypothetical protein